MLVTRLGRLLKYKKYLIVNKQIIQVLTVISQYNFRSNLNTPFGHGHGT